MEQHIRIKMISSRQVVRVIEELVQNSQCDDPKRLKFSKKILGLRSHVVVAVQLDFVSATIDEPVMLTRASSRKPQSSTKKPTITSMLDPDNEVIIISDDNEPVQSKPSTSSRCTNKMRNKRKAPVSPIVGGDVLEIMSSSEEDDTQRVRRTAKKTDAEPNPEVAVLQKKLKLVQAVRVYFVPIYVIFG
jgi:hypothetical protein